MRKEPGPVESRRYWRQKFHDDRARSPQQRTAGPEQSRIERSRHARQSEPGVEMYDARFVAGFDAGRAARAFRKDHELAWSWSRDRLLRPRGHAGKRGHARTAVDRDEARFPHVPAE